MESVAGGLLAVILVTDAATRRSITDELALQGVVVEAASDADELRTRVEAEQVDLVVAEEQGLPMGAAELRALARDHQRIGVLVLTEPDPASLANAITDGADDAAFVGSPPEIIAARLMTVGRSIALHRNLERERAVAEEEAARLAEEARLDPMTGLGNRRALDEALPMVGGRMARYGETWALVLIDLDRFKDYNDVLGHAAGDELLRRFGVILRDGLRVSDLAFRYGGDEFLLLLTLSHTRSARDALTRIRRTFANEAHIHPGNAPWTYATFSAGFAVRTGRQGTDGWTEEADRALYRAKDEGRNRIVGNDAFAERRRLVARGIPVAERGRRWAARSLVAIEPGRRPQHPRITRRRTGL